MGSAHRVLQVLSVIGLGGIASFGMPGAAHASGDSSAQQAKRLACLACHSTRDPVSEAPGLAGQRESYLLTQLRAFKRGDRRNAFMNAMATQLSDADIVSLAAYWSRETPGKPDAPEAVAAIQRSRASFPKDFPRDFVHYLTSNDPERKTVNKYYITKAGFEAAKHNKPFPEGTIIVATHALAKLGADKRPLTDQRGRWTIDKLEDYATMETRAGWGNAIPELLRNADWNYNQFTPDKRPRPELNQATCLACHKPQSTVSYLFSFKELRDHATSAP